MKDTAVIITFFALLIAIPTMILIKKPNAANSPNQSSALPSAASSQPSIKPEASKSLPPPAMELSPTSSYSAILHTDKGDIAVALNSMGTPKTVNNFVYLARNQFYDNTVFHRVIKGFMIQGGDPQGNGRGGPGYRFDDEPITDEYTRGTVAMANSGPNTNGSQFFIMHADYPLPKNYVIFGHVTAGLDVVDKIAQSPVVASDMGEMSVPATPTVVKSIEIVETKSAR